MTKASCIVLLVPLVGLVLPVLFIYQWLKNK